MRRYGCRRGGILSGLLLIALAIVCLIAVGGLFVARNVRVERTAGNDGDSVSIDTPAGNLSMRAHEKAGVAAAGVPLYPGAGAAKDSGGDAVIQWRSNHGGSDGGFAVSASEVVTSDPLDKVVDYYRNQLVDKFPHWVIVKERGGSVRLELKEGGYKRIVAIRGRNDGTHIGVASVGERASN